MTNNYSEYLRDITIDLQILRDNGICVANGLDYGVKHIINGSAVEAFVEGKEGDYLSEIKLWFNPTTGRIASNGLDLTPYYVSADEAKYNRLYEAREAILEHYNDTKGMVVSAIHKMRQRIAEEEQKALQFEEDRKQSFALCKDLLSELWELEKSGIFFYENTANFTSLVPAESGTEAWAILLEDGHSLSVQSSKEHPCRVLWAKDRTTVDEVLIMDTHGLCLSRHETIHEFMNVAFAFMESFISRHNIQ